MNFQVNIIKSLIRIVSIIKLKSNNTKIIVLIQKVDQVIYIVATMVKHVTLRG